MKNQTIEKYNQLKSREQNLTKVINKAKELKNEKQKTKTKGLTNAR